MKASFAALAAGLLTLLSACTTAPLVCPSPPVPPAPEPLGPSFQDQMQLFLSGKPPELTPYALPLPAAKDKPTRMDR